MDFKEIDRVLFKAQDEGIQAFADGISKFENPYEPGSLNFDSWNSGWKISQEDHKEIQDMECPLRPEDFEDNYL